ncbi:MAG: response regulator [Balneolaceae bacterium]
MSTVKCVCIIDDDKIYAYGVKKIIDKHNLSRDILIFENGEEALEALTKMHERSEALPELILLDIDMPLMNGWEFLSEFESLRKNSNSNIEIYVISSKIDQNNGELYKVTWDEKVADFISKPVKPEDLQKIMA